ncbi:MAG: hypothetical protein HeimC3_26350 [Candidatus Heimdallarchaeota archaeon LC_3]|nr:MAG: hypothetical protein HeimC3_26350 [Candidatus Heimdallarchaeota archaeon LC_3]
MKYFFDGRPSEQVLRDNYLKKLEIIFKDFHIPEKEYILDKKFFIDNDLFTKYDFNIDSRIKLAVESFFNAIYNDQRKTAIRNLGDVLEYLKNIVDIKKLPGKANSDLFNILNNFDIRHNNLEQKSDFEKEIWYEWLFYILLHSIFALIQLNKKIMTL